MSQPVLRFAPSPNGHLHLGHAFSALWTWEAARRLGGRFLLRIEDIDLGRCRPAYEASICEDLAWLGLEWEEPVRRQSEHFGDYEAALARLENLGIVYPCFATRAEIARAVAERESTGERWPRDPDGAPLYPGIWRGAGSERGARHAAEGRRAAMRLDMAKAIELAGTPRWQEQGGGEPETIRAEPSRWGDVVLARKDVPTSYHLAVVIDDALQGVTYVTRGLDLYHATSIHRVLQELLGLPAPIYEHHRLVLGDDGAKLAKSRRDTALRELRAAGATPADIRRLVGV
jgi:glutamyl-Q tRNA(Asp) synthetase